jgi:hypothetical protein
LAVIVIWYKIVINAADEGEGGGGRREREEQAGTDRPTKLIPKISLTGFLLLLLLLLTMANNTRSLKQTISQTVGAFNRASKQCHNAKYAVHYYIAPPPTKSGLLVG